MMKTLLLILCVLLLASPAWAFPDNGVLDTFTGTDGTTPPNSNWTNARIAGGGSQNVVIQDNAVSTASFNVDADAYWNAATFGAACEAYATIVNIANNQAGSTWCRLVNIGVGTTDGYGLEWNDAGSSILIKRLDNTVETTLGATITQTITAGDSIGIKTVGDQICVWYKVGAGAWTELSCRTDATYSAGGSIGLSINGETTVGGMDDFGGGTVATATLHNLTLTGVGN